MNALHGPSADYFCPPDRSPRDQFIADNDTDDAQCWDFLGDPRSDAWRERALTVMADLIAGGFPTASPNIFDQARKQRLESDLQALVEGFREWLGREHDRLTEDV